MQTTGNTPIEALLDVVSEGLLVVDEVLAVRYANPAACRLLAMSADTLLGHPASFPVPADGTGEVTLPTGLRLALQVQAITWHDLPARLITLRTTRQASMASTAGEQIYRSIARQLPDGDIYLIDHDFRILMAEGTVIGRYGFSSASLEGRTLAEAFGEEGAKVLEPLYATALAGQEGELEAEVQDHTYRIRTVPLRDDSGQIQAALGLTQDISKFKHIERQSQLLNQQLRELLEREQRARADAENHRTLLQSILDHAPAMMCVLQGPQHVYQYVNEPYARAVGRTPDELRGKPLSTVIPGGADSETGKILDEAYRTRRPVSTLEMRIPIDLDGKGTLLDKYFTFTSQPMHDPDGSMTGLLVHVLDVTDQVLARRTLEQRRQEVVQLNQMLERQVRELAAANEELEAFTHSVSHDLRGPLRRIDGFGHLLLKTNADRLDEQGLHYITRIRSSVQHMNGLIEDLLALAQVARLELKTSNVHLSDMAREILSVLAEQAPERRVTVRIAPEVHAWGDARLLHIALENLLENAWKFTSRAADAMIELATLERDGERVFFVRDNGAGFDPALGAKLFTTFARLHSPTEFPGTGIGLTTVKRVIERHRGRIWAEGCVDRGATFYFTLAPPMRQ